MTEQELTYEIISNSWNKSLDDTSEFEKDGIDETIKSMVAQALEKQIPKKPIVRKGCKDGIVYLCSACKTDYNRFYIGKCYCMNCGQKLDWSVKE